MRFCIIAAALFAMLCAAVLGDEKKSSATHGERIDQLIKKLGSNSPEERQKASNELQAIGVPALPKLHIALKDPDIEVIRRAKLCIEEIARTDRVGYLSAELQNADSKVRAAAADQLMEMRSDAKSAVPALIQALDDKDNHVRIRAAVALGHIGPEAKTAVPKLMQLMNDKKLEVEVRRVSAFYLSWLGKDAECAIPDLLRLLESEHPELRKWAANALSRLASKNAEVINSLLDVLGDNDPSTRAAAAMALGKIGEMPARCVPRLIEVLKNGKGPQGKNDPRESYLLALGMFGKESRLAIPAARDIAKNEREPTELRECAVMTLQQIGQEATEALKELTKVSEPHVSVTAIQALKRLGKGR